MRDIRPAPGRQGDDSNRDDELYEASMAAKRELQAKPTRRMPAKSAGRSKSVPLSKIHVPKAAAPRTASSKQAKQRIGSGERKAIIIVFILVLLSGAIASYLFLPTATVALRLKTAPLLVDEEVRVGAGSIAVGDPYFREVAVSGVIPVTNTERVGTKATGQVTLINRSSEQQPIKEQSRLVTSAGQLFYMQRHAIVPPNSSIAVPVEAAEAGEEGNIEPQRLNFAALEDGAQQLIYAEAETALSGGSGEEIAVVSEEDMQAAQRNAGEVAKAQVESEIRSELPDGWSIIEESWVGEIVAFEPAAQVGDKTPELSYRASVVVRAMGFEQERLLAYLREVLNGQLEEEFMLFPGPISYTKSVKNVDWEVGETTLDVQVTHTTIPRLNLDTLKEKLAGRSKEEAREYLEGLPGVISAELELWPFWVQQIPRIEKRISLELMPEKQP